MKNEQRDCFKMIIRKLVHLLQVLISKIVAYVLVTARELIFIVAIFEND